MPANLPIVLPRSMFDSEDPADRVQAVVDYVNILLEGMYLPDEIPRAALVVYYTDYYLAQVNNGGVSQFVFNGKWDPAIVACVDEGLRASGATEHHALFAEVRKDVAALGPRLREFLDGDLFGENPLRDRLERNSTSFFAIEKKEPALTRRLADYVAALPSLEVLDQEPFAQRVRALTVLDEVRQERLRKAEERAVAERSPVEVALRAWAEAAGKPFDRLTAFSPEEWEGGMAMAIHFLAGGAHFRAIPVEDERFLLVLDDDGKRVARLPLVAPEAPAPAKRPRPAAPRRNREPQKAGGIPRWAVIAGAIVLFLLIRLLIRASSH